MSELDSLESRIQEDVEQLREQFSQTRELYREVCALLFFRYGITPTTNKLYRLVRKGSMSVPTDALSHFWKELREKSKVRIEQSDLPEDVSKLAGELISTLWTKSQLAAQQSLKALRDEIEIDLVNVRAQQEDTLKEKADIALKLQLAEEGLQENRLKLQESEQLLKRAETEKLALEKQRQEAELEQAAQRSAMESEIEQLQFERQERETQHKNTLELLHRDIEQEQSNVIKLNTELVDTRLSYANLQDQNKVELSALELQLADVREGAGELKGQLQLTQVNNEQLNHALLSKERALQELTSKLINLGVSSNNWTERIQRKKAQGFIKSHKHR